MVDSVTANHESGTNRMQYPAPTHTINQNGARIQSNRQTPTTGTEIRRRRKARPLTRFRSRTGALADDSRSDERGSHPLRWLIRSKAVAPSDPWRGTGIQKRLANITVFFLNRSTFAVTSSVFHKEFGHKFWLGILHVIYQPGCLRIPRAVEIPNIVHTTYTFSFLSASNPNTGPTTREDSLHV
mmetsp:Transcript_50037/g.50395  ORF Transcript_50037/g.50395 Transcript_50037/m.50395 type:complete len:184 (-) Transcript_50037:29-580(-)